MFWWFERGGSYVRCEALQLPSGIFELRVVEADGSEQVEHFNDSDALAKRQIAVEQRLSSQGWSGPHGWNL